MVTGGAQRRVTVAVIDDQDVVHAGVEAWCAAADPPIDLVGNYLHPKEFLTAFPAVPHEVDVVLLDLQIEGSRPDFDILRTLSQAGQRVVVYSHLAADEIILSSLDLGAVTYLVKSEGRLHLIEALHSAASGTPYIGPRMAKALAHDRNSGRIKLSEREIEVLRAWFQTESKELVGKRLVYRAHHRAHPPATGPRQVRRGRPSCAHQIGPAGAGGGRRDPEPQRALILSCEPPNSRARLHRCADVAQNRRRLPGIAGPSRDASGRPGPASAGKPILAFRPPAGGAIPETRAARARSVQAGADSTSERGPHGDQRR